MVFVYNIYKYATYATMNINIEAIDHKNTQKSPFSDCQDFFLYVPTDEQIEEFEDRWCQHCSRSEKICSTLEWAWQYGETQHWFFYQGVPICNVFKHIQ